jgi:radical SAM protein with 4Fe4S-binding SPASM domain
LDYEAYLEQIRSLIAESNKRGPEYPTSIGIRVFQKRYSDAFRDEVQHQEALYSTAAIISRLRDWGEQICGLTTEELRRMYPERFGPKFRIPLTHRASLRTNPIMRWWQREADRVDTKYPALISYCSGFNDQFAVLADGRVTACCLDYEGHTALGNVKERPLEEILKSSPVTDFVGSFDRLRPPTKTCAKCLGGNTIPEWIGRQAVLAGSEVARQGFSKLKAKLSSS